MDNYVNVSYMFERDLYSLFFHYTSYILYFIHLVNHIICILYIFT